MASSDHALYRFYNDAGQLLYIGITRDPSARWKKHSAGKPWWTEVRNITVQPFPDRDSALRAERAAITDEQPRYNVAHNQPPEPAPATDRGLLEGGAHGRWRWAASDWASITGGEQLPHCNCCLPSPASCGDPVCVLAIALYAQGAMDGREEAARMLRTRVGHAEYLAEHPQPGWGP